MANSFQLSEGWDDSQGIVGTATANFDILYVDGHFQANKIGSRNEYTDV